MGERNDGEREQGSSQRQEEEGAKGDCLGIRNLKEFNLNSNSKFKIIYPILKSSKSFKFSKVN